MSQIFSPSPKHCAIANNKRYLANLPKHLPFNKKLIYFISSLLTSILCFIFIIYFTLRPSKPQFALQQADVYQLVLLAPTNLLNSSIQLTFLSTNPNQRVGIYYDEFQVYAAYRGQQITADTPIPGFYQGHQETNLLTASLVASGLPVAPSFRYEVGRDQVAGRMVLRLKGRGKLRWKVGSWVSGGYRFNVDCVAVMPFGDSNSPSSASSSGPLSSRPQGTRCSTDV
ncbi:unnamed protein product [Linum trigynum]|uniref:Late embryogenesis abundant protein LEA-2 subgroup domain-containing protein n=1 Tax=Linum trigynum TaxID=586398 RepID=A0AAV2G2B2_9ROSI